MLKLNFPLIYLVTTYCSSWLAKHWCTYYNSWWANKIFLWLGRRVLIIVEAAAATAACQLVELPTNSPLVILSRNTIILICVSSCCNVQFADMETFALLLCDRFWKLNFFHRYFVFLSKCKIVELSNPKKNVSYGTYGKKSIENSPVSCNSSLKTELPNKS